MPGGAGWRAGGGAGPALAVFKAPSPVSPLPSALRRPCACPVPALAHPVPAAMDARARAKRYEKLDFLGEGQVSGRYAGGAGVCASPLGSVQPLRESRSGGPGAALFLPGRAAAEAARRLGLPAAGPGPARLASRRRRQGPAVSRVVGEAAGEAGCPAGLRAAAVRGRSRGEARRGRGSSPRSGARGRVCRAPGLRGPAVPSASPSLLSLLRSIRRGIRTPTRSWPLKR